MCCVVIVLWLCPSDGAIGVFIRLRYAFCLSGRVGLAKVRRRWLRTQTVSTNSCSARHRSKIWQNCARVKAGLSLIKVPSTLPVYGVGRRSLVLDESRKEFGVGNGEGKVAKWLRCTS